MDKNEENYFSSFINKLRKQKNISMEKLCEGLCTARMAWYLECGEREPDKLLQDRLLERLGVGAEDYEHFLGYKEYDRWEARTKILHCIAHEKMERAELLLEEYCAKYNMRDRLEKQFYLGMLAQIRRYQGASEKELAGIFNEAVLLTVPGVEKKPLKELVLSFLELNLVLEAERYRAEGERAERYLEILEYIDYIEPDRRSIAKIYPKTVCFLYRCVTRQSEKIANVSEATAEILEKELLDYVNRALDILRDNVRLYYMWETLDARGKLMLQKQEWYARQNEQGKAKSIEVLYQENKMWKDVLENLYEEFHVPKETFEYCYLYVVKGVSCINDVIVVRRKMLGMTQQQLCENFCDVKTLQRLEKREVVPQRATAKEFFQRLGLPTEFTRTELVTENAEARELMEKLRIYVNEYNREEADKVLREVKKLVSAEVRSNQQVLMRQEILSRWDRGELTSEEYCEQLKKALELTLPFEAFLQPGKKILTNEEQSCIQNMMLGMDKESQEYILCLQRFEELYRAYPKNEMQEAVSSMYEYIMGYVESELGNQGKLDKSDAYNEIMLRECLRLHRLSSVSGRLYARWWNYAERERRDIPNSTMLVGEEELTKCILLSALGKKGHKRQFYEEKLKKIKG